MRLCLVVVVLVGACGDNKPPPLVAKPQELGLLPALFDGPFNHDVEPTIAAYHGRVIVASGNLALVDANSFEVPPVQKVRKDAVRVSNDGGRSFAPAIDPIPDGDGPSNASGDIVIRVAGDGTFFLTALTIKERIGGVVSRSTDGTAWTPLYSPDLQDKPWLAIDDANQQLFVAGAGGYWRLSFAGTLLQETLATPQSIAQFTDAYALDGHARFATVGSSDEPGDTGPGMPTIREWDGTATQPTVLTELDSGPDADFTTRVSWSLGPLPDGSWSVRTRRENGRGSLVLRTEISGVVTEKALTGAEGDAFLPAASMDESGRLHVVWYDSSQAQGRLLYASSVGPAPFTDGFIEPVVVDDNACPGNGWWPDSASRDASARRLREYIGIAVDDGVVHAAWTHAPQAPSRIWVTRISPPPP